MEPSARTDSEAGYERCRLAAGGPSYHEGLLLLDGLEASVTKLGGGVDEFEVDLLLGATAGLNQQRLEAQTELVQNQKPNRIPPPHDLGARLTLRRVSTLFLVPTTQPFSMTKSLVT